MYYAQNIKRQIQHIIHLSRPLPSLKTAKLATDEDDCQMSARAHVRNNYKWQTKLINKRFINHNPE
jgi:hypothetical protein